jgi:hypothetical protein
MNRPSTLTTIDNVLSDKVRLARTKLGGARRTLASVVGCVTDWQQETRSLFAFIFRPSSVSSLRSLAWCTYPGRLSSLWTGHGGIKPREVASMYGVVATLARERGA